AEPAPLPRRSRRPLARALQPRPGAHRPERSGGGRRAAARAARAPRPAAAVERPRARRHGGGARDRALAARVPALLRCRLALAVAARVGVPSLRRGARVCETEYMNV